MTQTEHLNQAADWFDRFDDLDEQGKVALSNWLSDPAHQKAFTRVANALGQPEVIQAAMNLAKCEGNSSTLSRPTKPVTASRKKPAFSYIAMAASVMAVAVLLVYMGSGPRTMPHGSETPTDIMLTQSMQVTSPIAQPLSKVLNDGSAIYLSGDTLIDINHNATWREVNLNKGQAYFDVAHEPERPFIVNVDKVKVQVIGTAFDIDKLSDKTVIRVYDGIVKVVADKVHTLTKGDGLTLENGHSSQVFRLKQNQLPSWRSGWLDMQNEPLSRAVERFSRYLHKPVEIHGRKDTLLTGRFNIAAPEDALKLLARAQGFVLEEHSDRFVLVESTH